jgi:hypothetical protein
MHEVMCLWYRPANQAAQNFNVVGEVALMAPSLALVKEC